ncbi:type II toxin-antitoxin system HipA family toxin [Pseudomonas sp. BN417]|uniref:type II toxin-antitoxin system HipA family toxin n=1 Tax=Pseudomonas sp. BN417 TaxID=2567890 RepID=UPI002454166E|nr:type II toxin-antitoxin system HipA family toxin [Pseudomonas sp. BN417]MDH4557865.1 type II toxin-antitoxin system HipA family toxin [Pseudomonas sp. BN417]
MPSAYIYMECPITGATVTLGRLTLDGGIGTFLYAPEAVEGKYWVPDPIRFPLSSRPITVLKNGGVPGFIDDAMPDGWGERLLRRTRNGALDPIQLLLLSPNEDRAGNIMAGEQRTPRPGVGEKPMKMLDAKGLDQFIEVCAAIYDSQLTNEQLEALKIRDQRSAVGGARPKRTYRFDHRLILAKPRDKFDHYDLPAFEYACMTFAAHKGMSVARTALHRSERGNTLLVERFDRKWSEDQKKFHRIPMMSGLTLLDAEWRVQTKKGWIYAALADELYRRGAPDADRQELYRRMAYNALVGNSDDHPRNHAVIWQDGVWRLSPMYDVLPVLGEGPAQGLAMDVGMKGPLLSRGNLLSHHQHFALSEETAAGILDEVAAWEPELKDHYAQHLAGAELDAAVEATSGKKLLT